MANKTRLLIVSLILVIVILGGVLTYAFWIKPTLNGYAVQRQVEGAQVLYVDIVRVVSQCQTYPLPVGNQTIHLVAMECLQQAPPQAQ